MSQFANMHEIDYLEWYGSDVYDAELVDGLPRFLSGEYCEARQRARIWLARHPDRASARFSLERTISMYAERSMRTGGEMTGEESDAVLAMSAREVELREAFLAELNRVALEVTGDE